jgi:hypothetical protein
MTPSHLAPCLLGIGVLVVSACDLVSPLGIGSSPRHSSKTATAPARPSSPATRTTVRHDTKVTVGSSVGTADQKGSDGVAKTPQAPPVNLVGMGEEQVRALLGPPATEEDRPPGKVWRYRMGGCTLDLSLFPDVQTRKFGTLTYEVRSDDDTTEGKRICLADLQSRVQAR